MFRNLNDTKSPAVLPVRLTESQAEAAIRAKRVELETQELELKAQFRREQLEAEQGTIRANQAAQAKVAKVVQARSTRSTRLDQWRNTWSKVVAKLVPFLPLVLVNSMAVMGQTGWGREHLDQFGGTPDDAARWAVALLFASALESLGLFQGYYANRAVMRGDSAGGLYLGAFATSTIVAALNYSHYASTTKDVDPFGLVSIPAPTATAVVFALFSLISPAFWRIHSRAVNRDALKAAGEIDTRAVKLSMARKLWHPWRSACVMWHATWEGVESPAEAIALWEARRVERAARKENGKVERVTRPKKSAPATTAPTVTAKHVAPIPTVTAIPAPVVAQKSVTATAAIPAPAPAPVQDVAAKFPAAWAAYDSSARGGNPLTQRALAREHKIHRRYAAQIIETWKARNP